MAKSDKLNSLFESILSEPDEVAELDEALETQPVTAEVVPPEAPPAPADDENVTLDEEKPEPVEAEVTPAEAKPDDEPVKPKKKPSPAQERIQELVKEKNEYAQQLAGEREKWARLEERQKLLREASDAQQNAELQRQALERENARRANERPDPSLDPNGAEIWDLKEETQRLRQEYTQARAQVEARFQESQVQSDVQRFTTSWQADINAFKASHPNYEEAANFATAERVKFWQSIGHPEQEAKELVTREALVIAKNAMDHGKSPSNIYWDLAHQWGYKTQAQAAPARSAIGVTPQDKLAQIAAGQKVTGFSNRSPDAEGQDDSDIENMSEAQFATIDEDRFASMLNDPKTKQRLMKRFMKSEGLA